MDQTHQGPGAGHDDPEDDEPPQPASRFISRLIGAFARQTTAGGGSHESDTSEAGAKPGILNLRRMRVEDVAVPKSEIIAVSVGTTLEELVATFTDCGKTRLPVFDGTLDTPIGIVNMKDLALKFGFNGASEEFDLRGILRPLLFVPPSMPLGVLLQKMQAERIHMALVIDEYGGTDGLVTIEDLIEQVVGEIEDEHDVEEATPFVEERPGCWLALAKTPLDEFQAAVGIDLTSHEEIDEEEVDTLGGLAVMLAGHVPARGEVIPHPDGPEFEVIDADVRRVKRLRLRLNPVQRAPKQAAE